MLPVLNECAAAVRQALAAARNREDVNEEVSGVFDVITTVLGRGSREEIQAGRGDNNIATPFKELREFQQAIDGRRVQMEGDLDLQNGALVPVVMLEDYGDNKAGERGRVPASELEYIPCRPLTEYEIHHPPPDPCAVPGLGDQIRIASMLHGDGHETASRH